MTVLNQGDATELPGSLYQPYQASCVPSLPLLEGSSPHTIDGIVQGPDQT